MRSRLDLVHKNLLEDNPLSYPTIQSKNYISGHFFTNGYWAKPRPDVWRLLCRSTSSLPRNHKQVIADHSRENDPVCPTSHLSKATAISCNFAKHHVKARTGEEMRTNLHKMLRFRLCIQWINGNVDRTQL